MTDPDPVEGDDATENQTVSIVLNPMWRRVFDEHLRLASRIKGLAIAITALCAELSAEEAQPDLRPADRARGESTRVYWGRLGRIQSAVQQRERWKDIPSASTVFGSVLDDIKQSLEAADASANGEPGAAQRGEAAAARAVAVAVGLGSELRRRCIDPVELKLGEVMRTWPMNLRIQISTDDPD